jgi:outer membrane receptor protein involved in Fe transport
MQSRVPLDRFPGSRTEEGRVLIDAEGSVELPAGFRLSLDLRNLTDKRDAVDSFQYPLPGFAWFMSVEKEWKGGDDETDD